MSFILEALKKSESERQRQSGPALLEMRIVPPARALPAWAMVVGALLIVSVAVLAWMAWRPLAQPAAAAPQLATAAAQPRPDAAHAAVPGAGPGAGAGTGAANGPVVTEPPAAPPAVAAGSVARTTGVAAAADTAESADAPINPADTEPAIAPGPGASPASRAHASLHNYAEVSGTVPDLRLDLHVYAPNPADRYAFINMHRVREGDTTPEGVQVRQITREGVVLEYHGAEFLLGR
jgi:general secretion pathway protein B